MDARTLKALKDSIRHWSSNVKATIPGCASVGEYDCALCNLFIGDHCKRCPVKQTTGRKFCQRSPYIAARRAYVRWHYDDSIENRTKWRAAAQAELNFLRSLLRGAEP